MKTISIAAIIIVIFILAFIFYNFEVSENTRKQSIKDYIEWKDAFIEEKKSGIIDVLSKNSIPTADLTLGLNDLYKKIRYNEVNLDNSFYNSSFCLNDLIENNCNPSSYFSNLSYVGCRNPELYCKAATKLTLLAALSTTNSLIKKIDNLGKHIDENSGILELNSSVLLSAFSMGINGLYSTSIMIYVRDKFDTCIENFGAGNITEYDLNNCVQNVYEELEILANKTASRLTYEQRLSLSECAQNAVSNKVEDLRQGIYDELTKTQEPISKIIDSIDYASLTRCNKEWLIKIKDVPCLGKSDIDLLKGVAMVYAGAGYMATCWTTTGKNLSSIE